MGKGEYRANKIIVNSTFHIGNPLTWANAFTCCTTNSVVVLNSVGKIMMYNNRFGTLDDAREEDLVNLRTIFNFYAKFYKNALQCRHKVEQVLICRAPAIFRMHRYSGEIVECVAYPALDGRDLAGVVLSAHIIYGTAAKIQGKEDCYEPTGIT